MISFFLLNFFFSILCSAQYCSAGLPQPRWYSVPHRRLNENMWTAFPEGVPTVLITLTWILWRQTILQTAGDQSKPTWNMPPATFTLGSMLFKMEHFHLCLWLFYRQSWSPHGASSAKWFIPPPPTATSTLQSCGKGVEGRGKIYFKLFLSLGMQSTREGWI